MTDTLNIRHAVETNEPFRLVEREDIVPGRVDIVMIDLTHFRPELHPALWITWKIRLDDEPLHETKLDVYVLYHCIEPGWDGQCFVPLDDFLGNEDLGACDNTRYWIKFDPAVVRDI